MSDISEEMVEFYMFPKNVKTRLIAGGALIGAGIALAAGTTGYLLAKKKLEKKFEQDLEVELAKSRAFFNKVAKAEFRQANPPTNPPEPPEELRTVDEAADALAKYQGRGEKTNEEEDTEPEVRVEVNVFTGKTSDFEWDYEEEAKLRSPDAPYVIHEDEWSESDLNKVQLTYYEGDHTLTDEKDEPIPAIEEVIGIENLDRFGHGTEDARVVFIRNEKMDTEFEVCKHDGKYAEVVLGFQHSAYPMRHPNRFRDVDD